MTPYPDQLTTLTAADPTLGEQVAGLRNLEVILHWAPTAGVAMAGVDLVQQDEYSYDLFLPLADGRWLVFGVT